MRNKFKKNFFFIVYKINKTSFKIRIYYIYNNNFSFAICNKLTKNFGLNYCFLSNKIK